jgi:phosphomannomutase
LNLPVFQTSDSLEIIHSKKYKVVVDAVNASGSEAIPRLLEKFGCEVIRLYCENNGEFPHTPEPIPANLTDLAKAVKEHQASFGIAVDPDADRLVLIDETGTPIGEEKTIVLATEAILDSFENFENHYDKKVVVNLSTTRMVEDIALKFGATVERSAVGEINVVNKMKSVNAVIGGEGSGGVILPASHYGRDSLVGTALILHLLAKRDVTLSELSSGLPAYVMLKTKQPFEGSLDIILKSVLTAFPAGMADLTDGIRIDFTNSWVQLRTSNTEPIIRIISEALTQEKAEELISRVQSLCN